MTLKVMTANLNGIRAAERKGFFEWLDLQNPDILCIQETKAQMAELMDEKFRPEPYHCFFSDAEKKGYSGVGIYCKEEPLTVKKSLSLPIFEQEGRIICAEFSNYIVCSLYLPSGTSGETRQHIKYQCMDCFFEDFLTPYATSKKPVIVCGDWNIAHQQQDLKNWRNNQKNSGFLPEERAWLDRCFNELGWIDAFRAINQEQDQYTWWTYRANARANNVGWRIDYQIVSPNLKHLIKHAEIAKDPIFSDHAPLTIHYQLP